MEGNIAATYSLIYRFLKQRAQNKAAEAVKKAAKPFVVLRDDIEQKGPLLEDIIKEWKGMENTKSQDTGSSSENSSDDSSSDSEDDSSDTSSSEESEDTSGDDGGTSDGSDKGTAPKSSPQKPVERDTSVTLSSAGEIIQGITRVAESPTKSAEKVNKASKVNSDSCSSSEGSTSDSSDAESSSSSSNSSDNSGSSDEDEQSMNKPPQNNKTSTSAGIESTSASIPESEDGSDSEPQQTEDVHVAKKRKISENKVAAATPVTDRSQHIVSKKPSPKVKERFQRVKAQSLAPELLLDNGYEARGGAVNDYGKRAHRDLAATRGTGFRKEKNKKKRGSYRGGEITMENHSIRFAD